MRNIDRWKRRTSENQKSKRWMLGLHGWEGRWHLFYNGFY
jgi:hypothetical protein